MGRLLLVRHGEPTARWDEHPDPGLSTTGAAQAETLASRLEGSAPTVVVSSPLARARETAAPLARRLGVTPVVEPRVGEIPTRHAPSAARTEWLRDLFAGPWRDADAASRAWRADLLDALRGVAGDATVFTHYVAINVAVGAATGDDRVRCCSPAHCSVTELAVGGGGLHLVALGAESTTPVT